MLLYASGSSCAGKTTTLPALEHLPALAVHDFDEIGVPSTADTTWRQSALEEWVRFALQKQAAGIDVFLAGQSPLGEVLATPSAPQLDGVAVCLLDVEDDVRRWRLQARDGDRWDFQAVDAFVGWGRWHREHVADPQARRDVITTGGWPRMRWDRWTSWGPGDARWTVTVFDTTHASPEAVGADVAGWVVQRRQALVTGALPLSYGWASR